jgi:hypothetical protein
MRVLEIHLRAVRLVVLITLIFTSFLFANTQIYEDNQNLTSSTYDDSLVYVSGIGMAYWLSDYPVWLGFSYLYSGGGDGNLKDNTIVFSGAIYNIFFTEKKRKDEVFLTNMAIWMIWLLWPSEKNQMIPDESSLGLSDSETIMAWNFDL